MKDIPTLLAAANRLFASGDEGVLVTLVHTKGSTYRRPGARMLVLPGCRTVGIISGGCLEAAVARDAWAATRTTPHATLIVESAPEDDTWSSKGASGCHGRLYLLAERIAPNERHLALQALAAVHASQQPATLAHFFQKTSPDALLPIAPPADPRWSSEAATTLANATSRWVEHESTAAFLEYLAPPPHLLLCGAGDDAQPVARIAGELGWIVDVVDTRAKFATRDRFPAPGAIATSIDAIPPLLHPHTAAVLMSHRFVDDLDALAHLLQAETPLPYVGLLGPRRRTDRMLAELALRNLRPTPRQAARLHSPIGLDLGATAPETIALSIIAEIQAVLAGRDAHFLSSRVGPIHPAPSPVP